jgi:hypothetical protein
MEKVIHLIIFKFVAPVSMVSLLIYIVKVVRDCILVRMMIKNQILLRLYINYGNDVDDSVLYDSVTELMLLCQDTIGLEKSTGIILVIEDRVQVIAKKVLNKR